jgi:hypothetical protein
VFKHGEPAPSGSPIYFHSPVIRFGFVHIGRPSIKFTCERNYVFSRRLAFLLFNLISYKSKKSPQSLMFKLKMTSGRSIMRAKASESKPMLYSQRLGVTWL